MVTVPARQSAVVSTGYFYDVDDPAFVGFIKGRSSLAFRHGITAFEGVIDSDFKDEVKVLLFNNTNYDFTVVKGERIAQLVLLFTHTDIYFEVVQNERTGGFGSTGK
jgi:dUTP pyrophosphatase